MKAPSEMGKQLDSLSDVVSFGVAPGVYYTSYSGWDLLKTKMDLIHPSSHYAAFIFSAAAAWRLAKFNISVDQMDSFRGVPTPAAGLVVASFPLIIWYESMGLQRYFINVWILYIVIVLLSYLMLSNYRLMAMKFKNFGFADNLMKYILVALSIVSILFLNWLAINL